MALRSSGTDAQFLRNMHRLAYPFLSYFCNIYFCNIKGQTRQARWLLTNLTFYNQISEFFLLSIICVKSGFNLSRFYFKSVLEDEQYIILGIYYHFLHQTAPKSLIEFFYQSTLFFQRTDESPE